MRMLSSLSQQIRKNALLDKDDIIDEQLGLLADLPIATVQAAPFINNIGGSVSEYILLFRQPDAEVELYSEHFEDPCRYREMQSTTAKTWHVSFDPRECHPEVYLAKTADGLICNTEYYHRPCVSWA